MFSQTLRVAKDTTQSKYQPNFVIGVDVLNAGVGLFGERQFYQAFVSTRIKKRLHAIVDAGYDKNSYDKNGYEVKADGFFGKVGAFYMMTIDPENEFNGFYLGGKLAASFYNQEFLKVPVKGANVDGVTLSLPPSSQSAYWLEGNAGARIQVFRSNFFIDVNLQPRYLIYTTKQDEVEPMIIPGFGNSSGGFNLGFSWNIAYKF